MADWIISDTHFFHAGIIGLADRPFRTAAGEPDVRAMNEAMVANWNAVVRPKDRVFHLGDFAHRAGHHDDLIKIFRQLNGIKTLIRGNHDGRECLALPWNGIHDMLSTTVDSTKVVMCHYGMRDWPGRRRGVLQLYGHSHGRLPGNSQSMDVGVDVMGWSPVRINQIKAVMETLPPAVDPEMGADADPDGGLEP
ncbi:MAG: metallophosphoesterase family protein [Hyphomicrobiales bacterium]|jgi:calcineurin-like phosphoesterase family protein|nr:metallophosphoesterase family protein [Hyphomicrobiales bacterium]